MIRILFGPLLVLIFILSAAVLSPSRPAARNILNLPATPYRYADVTLPAHFTQPGRNEDNTPPDNPLSDHGAALGRVLFYGTRLSANSTTSCASCHVQAHAFADSKPFSKGFHGALTNRRAMPLVNLRYYQRARFFWDERAGNLEEMVLLPIQSRIEMGQDMKRVVDILGRDMMRNCSTCHVKDGNEQFFVRTPANTGLRRDDLTADAGVGDVTLRDADLGSFKSPSLRNVEVTAPYGRDGRFATLDALVDHYSDNPISIRTSAT